MQTTTIEILRETMLPEVARFIQATIDQEAGRPVQPSDAMLDTLRHRLVNNPNSVTEGALGHVLRTATGDVAGVNLMSVAPFVWHDRTLVGLSSSNFFVDPQARMQGFFLFRKYLAIKGIDFWYTTTSNENSGGLWQKTGGAPVKGSDRELYLPLRFGPLAEEVAFRRRLPAPLPRLMWNAAAAAAIVLKPRFASTSLSAVPCRDWETMEELAAQHRDPQRLTGARTAEHLRWIYGNSAAKTFELRNSGRTCGWFGLSYGRRGSRQQIRIATLCDLVGHKEAIDAQGLVRLLVELCENQVDALVFEGAVTLPLHHEVPRLWSNFHGCYRNYVYTKDGSTSKKAEAIELMPADGG